MKTGSGKPAVGATLVVARSRRQPVFILLCGLRKAMVILRSEATKNLQSLPRRGRDTERGVFAMQLTGTEQLRYPQIPHLTLLVWDLWFYRTCSLSTRRHICSDWAVKRVSGDVFESSGAPHMPNGGSLEAKEGMTRHGNSAELPSTDGLGKAAYAQGSAASADILWRALSSNSYEGWPRARRMINLLA